MTSHGVPRHSIPANKTEEAKQRELQKIRNYQTLTSLVNDKKAQHDLSQEAFDKTSDLLTENPEYYTIWNYRRMILQHLFSNYTSSSSSPSSPSSSNSTSDLQDRIQNLIRTDLEFLLPLLQQNPKCYWIWNHRLWLLQQTRKLLSPTISLGFWQAELALVGKMLNRDSRNFHGWGYRREVVRAIDSLHRKAAEAQSDKAISSMTQNELDYTTKMIRVDLSNFSAWHNRSKLILKILDERSANGDERRKMLGDELKLIHRALIDPYDQSLWFYHQNLMCVCDPDLASETMAPDLSDRERLEYLNQELAAIREMLDDEQDCKWIYQALISCSLLVLKINRGTDIELRGNISEWLSELRRLDPLRKGRWDDLEKSLDRVP